MHAENKKCDVKVLMILHASVVATRDTSELLFLSFCVPSAIDILTISPPRVDVP
jgi:hypothetical protein